MTLARLEALAQIGDTDARMAFARELNRRGEATRLLDLAFAEGGRISAEDDSDYDTASPSFCLNIQPATPPRFAMRTPWPGLWVVMPGWVAHQKAWQALRHRVLWFSDIAFGHSWPLISARSSEAERLEHRDSLLRYVENYRRPWQFVRLYGEAMAQVCARLELSPRLAALDIEDTARRIVERLDGKEALAELCAQQRTACIGYLKTHARIEVV